MGVGEWVRRLRPACSALLFGLALAATAGRAHAQLVVTGSAILDADLECTTSPCVVVAGDGVKLDGAGHTIDCNGHALGIEVTGSRTTVTDVLVVACGVGIDVSAQARAVTLRDNEVTQNREAGIRVAGAGHRLTANSAAANGEGIIVHATGTTLRDNAATGNLLRGIAVAAGAKGVALAQNVALGNAVDLSDDNEACAGNRWQQNDFHTDPEPDDAAGPEGGCVR